MTTQWKESDEMSQAHKDVLNGNIAAYEQWAGKYDEDITRTGYLGPKSLAPAFKAVLETKFKDQDSVSVLDIGCGTGMTVEAIKEVIGNTENLEFTGVDISPAMLAESKAKLLYGSLREIDLNNNEISGRWSIIVSTGTFVEGHVKLDAIFTILEQNLAEGGVFLLTTRSSYYDQAVSDKLTAQGWKVESKTIPYMAAGVTAELLIICKP